MTTSAHKTEWVNRTQNVWFHPFVFTSNAPRKGTCGVPAEFDEAIPLNKIKYKEQHDEKKTPTTATSSYYAYDHAGGSCGSRAQSQACLSYAEMQQSVRSKRVAARLGGGGLDALYHVIGNDEELQTKADLLFDQSLEQVNNRVLQENDLDCIKNNEFTKDEFGHPIDGIPYQMQAGVELNHEHIKYTVRSMQDDPNEGEEPDVYFYHSDHLGSASWITDGDGMPVQHLQYLPYGAPFVNQRAAGYNERFTFTGKERDEETGYGYFGARYMDYELMTM